MIKKNDNTSDDTDETPPAREPVPTPLLSVEEQSFSDYPIVSIPENELSPIKEHARRIANQWHGESENHVRGKLGEYALAKALGIESDVDLTVYADGGDGGVDLRYRGATIEVKTVGQHRPDPSLTVDQYEPLTADYYALVSRVGKTAFQLVGYTPRQFVADAPIQANERGGYHLVDQAYLFPFVGLEI